MSEEKVGEKRYYTWFFTHNNPLVEKIPDIVLRLAHLKANAVFQLESGEGENTPHLQGVVKFGSARTFTSVRRCLSVDLPGAHWERCRSWKRAVEYCTKEATRIDGPWTVGSVPWRPPPRDFWEPALIKPWQEAVLSRLRQPVDRRKLVYVHEPRGGVGKSTLARHIVGFLYRGRALCVRGGVGDIHYAVKQHVAGDDKKKEPKELWVLIIDIPRANHGAVSWQAIEDVLNGMLFSTKYEPGDCVFEPPHVVVFSNEAPDLTKLSADRWVVIDASDPNQVAPGPPSNPLDVGSYLGFSAISQ